MIFSEEMKKRTEEADVCVRSYLPEIKGHAKMLAESMDYSVGAGGKRLRPVMMKAAFEMCGGKGDIVKPFMAAIEFIHNYSLVHDDLPEMDNDMLRRGVPSTHAKYGSGMAVLAGDGLLNYAFETALKSTEVADAKDNGRILDALKVLAGKSGIYGMAGGQALDVEADKKDLELSEEEILFVYENKTAALLQASLVCGAILAGASDKDCDTLMRAGYCLGVAFQLQDDILDVTGSEKEIGKPVGSDERNGKKTYLSYLGFDAAEKKQEELSAEAAALVRSIYETEDGQRREAGEFLEGLIESLVKRRK